MIDSTASGIRAEEEEEEEDAAAVDDQLDPKSYYPTDDKVSCFRNRSACWILPDGLEEEEEKPFETNSIKSMKSKFGS